MADIRIKDLTTTASSTASDDFIAVDGTTNGTRKLSAFSPTFGGNATVTGTLTVNGTGLSQMAGDANSRLEVGSSTVDQRAHIGLVQRLNLGNPIFSKNLAGKASSDAYTTIGTTAGAGYSGIEFGFGGVIKLLNGTGATTANAEVTPTVSLDTNTTRVNIPLTTASTTTSTGALVVSGGVGVGGSINAGGSVIVGSSFSSTASDGKISITGTGNTTGVKELQFTRADGGDSTNLGLAGSAYAGVLTGLNSNDAYLYTSNSYAFRIFVGTAATNRFDFTSSQFKINPTTASTSTSSGALVVSGGVGVAGALYTGGGVVISGSTGVSVIGGRQWSFKANSSGGSPASGCVIRDDSAAADRLTIDINGDSVFAGSLKTSAPSGGTAAAWKLGTVATVSPTSPNRTIEVDIGGTIYYIHAKTTNN